MGKSKLFQGTATGAMMAAAFFSAVGANAQTVSAASATDNTEMVVTGSFIRGTPKDAAVPVDVFTTEELTANGISSPLEFIKSLPSVGAVLGDSNQFSAGAQGFQGVGSINLRGLGPDRTLVLVNGRRTISTPGFGFTDTNLIPFFAVDRIEILKDGAAATYGSDAIAGVANFITKRNFTGVQVQGDYEIIDGSDGNWTASVFIGQRFGKVNLSGGIGWQHRSELFTTARSFTQIPYAINPAPFSAVSTPGIYAATYLNAGVPATTFVGEQGCAGIGGTPDVLVPGLPAGCRFSFVPFDNLIEEEDRYQGILQADVDLSDRLRFHVEGTYSQTDQDSIAYSPSFPPTQGPTGSGSSSRFTVSPNNPGVPAFLAQNGLLPSTATRPLAAITAVLYRPLGWLGNPQDPVKGAGRGAANNKAYRVSGGFDMDFTESFRAQAYGTWWRSEREAFAPDIVGSRLQSALNGLGGPDCNPLTGTPGTGGCQWFNPFINAGPRNPTFNIANPLYVPGNENSAALVSWLQPALGNGTRQVEEQYVADLIFSGESKWDMGGGAIGYAFGFQYRSNDYSSRPLTPITDLNRNPCFREGDLSCAGTPTDGVGPFLFLGGSRPINVSQNVYALFGEVKVPITETLEVTGAARFENYGGSVGSTFNPKGSVRWNPVEWLVMRGSVGTTFRAPLARQVGNIAVTTLAGIQAAGNNFKSVDVNGNPNDLGPETAFTYNIGAVIEQSGFTASVDYWSFDFKDRITTTPAQAIASTVVPGTNGAGLANCASVFANLITFQGGCVQGVTNGNAISRVRTDWVNGPNVKTSGLDFSLNFQGDVGPGVFGIGANASYILKYDIADFVFRGQLVQAGYSAAGFTNYFRDPGTISRWRGNGFINYNISDLNLRYGVRYIGGATDDRCVNAAGVTIDPCISTNFGGTNFGAKVKSFTQHDFNATYNLPIQAVKAQLQFSVENFTNQAPSAARLELGYDPFIGNPFGRIYRFGIRATY